jgi:hypothetical protein
MKAKAIIIDNMAYVQVDPSRATHVKIKLPGPVGEMFLPVIIKGPREGTGKWTWNGDIENPTFKPSILTQSGHFAPGFDPEKDSCWCKYYAENPDETSRYHCFRCHTHINDGKVHFLGDCTHELKDRTLYLLDVQ